MSALMTCRSCMTNREGIIKALRQLGVPKDKIQVAVQEALKLQGYGAQTQDVEVLVANKDWHSGYSDFGFGKEGGSKEYSIYVDDMDDVGSLANKAGVKQFSKSVTQWYTAFMAQKALRNEGLYNAKIEKQGDKVVLVAT